LNLTGRSRWLWAIALCLLVGIGLRWVNLTGKVVWHDEVFTLLRVTGHIGTQVEQALFTGEPVTAGTLLQYQTFAPDSTFGDTLRSLVDHPEHPPLYYLLAWGWAKLLGTSVATFRSLSVIFSLLTLPALALLARELFGQPATVAIALMLFASSPVHVLYAQEAREYSLWVLLTVVTGWALLRAVRLATWKAWGLYTLSLALLFYTTVLSALVAIALAMYGFWQLPRRRWVAFGLANLGAIALFAPWMIVIAVQLARLQQATDWTFSAYPRLAQIKLWGLHFAAVWIDPSLPLDHPYTYLVPPLVLLLIGMSLYRNGQQRSPSTSRFLLLLTLVPALALIGGDLLRGTILSIHTRYFFPALVGAQLAIAGWLGLLIDRYPQRSRLALSSIVIIGLVNAGVIVSADTWWNKVVSYGNAEIARTIQTFENPIILSQGGGTTLGNLISLSYELPATTPFVVAPQLPSDLPSTDQTVLLFSPAEDLLQAFDCPAERLPVPGSLWVVPCR